jgi:hypothetical protein
MHCIKRFGQKIARARDVARVKREDVVEVVGVLSIRRHTHGVVLRGIVLLEKHREGRPIIFGVEIDTLVEAITDVFEIVFPSYRNGDEGAVIC